MAKFELAIPIVLKWEGGYAYDAQDPGGETNMGITDMLDGKIDHLVDVDGDKVGDVPIKALTVDQAKEVYRHVFWNRMLGDQVKSQNVANIIFDAFVNMGGNGIKVAQKSAGVTEDGSFGPGTLAKVNSLDPKTLFNLIKANKAEYYWALATKKPTLSKFLNGWLKRTNSFIFDPKLEGNV